MFVSGFSRSAYQLAHCHRALKCLCGCQNEAPCSSFLTGFQLWHSCLWLQNLPIIVERHFLLYTLNEHLARTAVLVQPLALPAGNGGGSGAPGAHGQLSDAPGIVTIDVPLPLAPSAAAVHVEGQQPGQDAALRLEGGGSGWNPFEDAPSAGSAGSTASANAAAVDSSSSAALPDRAVGFYSDGEAQEVVLPPGLAPALHRLGLGRSLGFVRLLQDPRAGSSGGGDGGGAAWLPLALWLGMPMTPSPLCQAVCNAALVAEFLDAPARAAQREGQVALSAALAELAARYGACSTGFAGGSRDDDLGSYVDHPTRNLRFGGGVLALADDLAPMLDGAMLLAAAAAS